MRRTYRSKKDVGNGLDRDALLNMDKKSSAFDAFYIQNIKQTKRELSCIGQSSQYTVASNKVRKRKYVKRILKETEKPFQTVASPSHSTSRSVFLTPDKSIRVNKAFDAFDMLLNSSSANVEDNTKNNETSEWKMQTRKAKTYEKKRKQKIKKINYAISNGTDSDKENSNETHQITCNTTDIRNYKLNIEKETKTNLKEADESINQIVNKMSRFNNIKLNSPEPSFMTYNKYKHRLTTTINSPILQKSPLCSTPFKEKYRSQSIYKFSPIQTNKINCNSPTSDSVIEEKNDSHTSIVFRPIELRTNDRKSLMVNKSENINDVTKIGSEEQHSSSTNEMIEHEKSISCVSNENNMPNVELCLLHNTEVEPFLGFPIGVESTIIEKCINLETQSTTVVLNNIGTGDCKVEDQKDHNSYSENLEKHEKKDDSISIDLNDTDDCKVEDQKYHDIYSEKHEKNDDSISIDLIDTDDCKIEDQKYYDIYSDKHEKNDDSISIDSSDKDSSYDTCNSEHYSQLVDVKVSDVQPRVMIEKLNDSVFIRYYEKMLKNDACDSENENDKSSYNTIESSLEDMSKSSKSDSSFDEYSQNSDDAVSNNSSFYGENNGAYKEEHSNNDDKISFVTTRKRNDVTNEKMISMFDNSKVTDCSDELDLTVLSNRVYLNFTSGECVSTSIVEATIIESDMEENISGKQNLYTNDNSLENEVCTDIVNSNTESTNEVTLYSIPTKINDFEINTSNNERKSSITIRRKTRLSKKTKSLTPQKDDEQVKSEITMKYDIIEVTSSDNACEEHGTDDSNFDKKAVQSKPKKVSKISKRQSNSNISRVVNSESSDDSEDFVEEQRLISIKKKVTNRCTRLSRRSTIISQPEKPIKSYIKVEHTSFSLDNNALPDNNESNKHTKRGNIQIDDENSTLATRSLGITRKSRDNIQSSDFSSEVKPCIVLQPGKKWERSLSIYRRMTTMDNLEKSILDESMDMKGRKYRQSVISTMELQESRGPLHNESINSRRSTFVSKPSRSTISILKDPNSTRTSLCPSTACDDLKGFLSDDCDDTIVGLSKLSLDDVEPEITVLGIHDTSNRVATARDYVLRRCNQTDAILFDECYPDALLKNCHKIGEGVYGEVFLWRARDGRARVMKIVPIAGHTKVNGEDQKDYHEIISEIVIAMELSALRAPIADIERHFDEGNDTDALDLHAIGNATDVFNQVLAVRCVYGSYPSRLLDLWDLYDECKGSENDNPAILPVDQQYIVLELANAGQDLESYQFNNAEQAHALFLQVAFGLAVGEEAYQFEHRDLHWGNVLIAPTEQKFATFVLRGRRHCTPRCGVAATIIDYSLSRVSLPASAPARCAALYNDLADDDGLFDAVGDYQFEVYRLMKSKLGNDWKNFEPYTNILWLHYTVDKMITALRYKRTNTKIHKHYIDKLKGIKNRILDYKSATDFVLTDNEY
uniref:non-specific serine/threonine protein kinase n=1 Tax=Bombyx mori TaxID=7091 RepID=A0A8R2M602_BOMMO|nr:uncharacterized protein LOC101745149 isoform X2 [Bombyx mori]